MSLIDPEQSEYINDARVNISTWDITLLFKDYTILLYKLISNKEETTLATWPPPQHSRRTLLVRHLLPLCSFGSYEIFNGGLTRAVSGRAGLVRDESCCVCLHERERLGFSRPLFQSPLQVRREGNSTEIRLFWVFYFLPKARREFLRLWIHASQWER